MIASTPCPELHAYRQLMSGQLAVAASESLLQHLETCEVCAEKIQTLPSSDTLIEWIRQSKSSSSASQDKHFSPLMQRLIQLGKSAGALTFSCVSCGKPLRVKEEAAGKQVKCPHCGKVMSAPSAAASGTETVDLSSAPSGTSKAESSSSPPTVAARGRKAKESELCSFLAPPQAADELGRLGPYRVLKVLGAGGMGVVFRAEDPQLQRIVALKAMLPTLAANESARQRFLREARAAAKLKHDHVVTIHQVGEDRGAPFLAMEFLEGEALEDRLKREGKLPLTEVLRIGREIADGLQAAHEHGLIHRDIKPANIWLEGKRGRVKILDFGLARSSADDVHLTQSGAIVGTPAYMPPEQARGDAVDGRCDLYSLGCVLYRLSTGELPFKADNTMSLLLALAIDQPKSPREINPDVPPPLADLILRLLAKDAAQRPATAGEVADALNALDSDEPVVVKAARVPAPPRRRRRLAVAVAGGVLALAAMLTVIVIRPGKPEEGSVTIETVDPDVELVFDGGGREYVVRDKKSGEEIKLPLGRYWVALKGGKEGLKLETDSFILKRGERVLVKVTRQAGEKPATAQANKQPVQILDLIDLFQDSDRIAVKGFTEKNQWTKAAGKLTYTSDGHSGKVMVPVSLNNVRDYEIDAQVRRLSGNSVFTFDLLTSPARQTGLDIFIGGRIELGLEDGRRSQIGAWPKSVGDSGHIVTRVRFDADGRRGSVTVTVNGEAAAQWSGELTAIGKRIEFHPNFPGERTPGAFCFRDSFEFSSWQLRVYQGHAQILRQRAATAPVQIPEPPPLAEWLKGRKILTVSQDGKGQFKTIKEALDALKPHQVVKVLDRGPYRESLIMGALPADTGLISDQQTVLEAASGPDSLCYLGPLEGFRLSGFRFQAAPSFAKFALCHWIEPSGLVIENCYFDWSRLNQGTVLYLEPGKQRDSKPAVVRDCFFHSGIVAFESRAGNGPILLLERNYFKETHLGGTRRFQKVVIRHNVFHHASKGTMWFEYLKEIGEVLEISNNTFVSKYDPVSIAYNAPKSGVVFRNNCSDRMLGLDGKALNDLGDSIKNWQLDHNCYIRRGVLPKASSDVLAEPPFLSVDPSHPDYLRIEADGPAAKGGAGGAWPSYIGALPPGPAPKEGDWFTRLRQRWGDGAPAAKPMSGPVQIPEPPPLAEWLKGRKLLTVSQDGKGQFKTIQEALSALKPGQVVKVLDRGPYRERLTLENVPADSGLVSEHGTLLEFGGNWRKVGNDEFAGHHLANIAGFRLHGFCLTLPDKKGPFFGLLVDQPDGFVLENCCFHTAGDRHFRDGQQFAVCIQANQIEFVRPVVVRESLFDGCVVFHTNIDGKEPRGTDFVLEKNYFTKSKGCTANGGFRKLIVRINVFGEDTYLNLWDQKPTALVEVSNNTVLGNVSFQASAPQGTVRLCNNLVTGRESFQMNLGAEKALAEASKNWQHHHNVFQGRVGSTLLPLDATDRLASVPFLSQEPGDADYLRLAADYPLAKGGAGGAWPSYIGALPPGPAPKEGDWFTRLREKWLKDKKATEK